MLNLWLLTFSTFTFCLAAGQSTKYALLGTSYHFTSDLLKQPDSILWTHGNNKVVEFEENKEEAFGPYRGRVTLDWETGELEITKLRFEDSGVYKLDLQKDYIIHPTQFELEVIDKVVKPTISCERNKGSSSDGSNTKATLLCSAEPRKPESLMSFKWKSKGMLHSGPKLEITLGDEHDEVEYICSVSNPLSSETASITAKECYNDDKTTSSSVALAAAGVSIFFVLLLILGVVFAVIFCIRRQKACFAPGDPENQTPTKGTGHTQKEEQSPLLEGENATHSLVRGHRKKTSGKVRQFVGDIEGGIFGKEKDSSDEEQENNKDEQEEPGSDPVSPRTGSPSPQDSGPDVNLYTSGSDQDQSNEEAKNQDQTRTLIKPAEEAPHSEGVVTTGQNDPDHVSVEPPEDEQSGQKPDPGQSGSDVNTGETKDPQNPSLPGPSSPEGGPLKLNIQPL